MEGSSSHTVTLPFSAMSEGEAKETLKKYSIGLTVEEARKIESLLGRAPTLTEAVIWGIQGSEHSSYKSSRRLLKMFPTTGKHVILGPKEDSGIVAITDGPPGKRWGLVISHESHNHPSQIVPYEGAATGVGGTVRDVVCMGARVVGCMDLLRLGDLKSNESRTIAAEVIRGIAGYGNPLGIPNLGGDTVFDSAYNNNCLVNAIAVGLVREDEIIHSYVPEEAAKVGYDLILVGKPTDRSGFGGAAFASISIEEEKREQNTGAVQEPNPFLERHLLASTYALFDWLAASGNLHRVSFKDLGAGGIVCSTVEQVAERGYGAEVDLDTVPVSIEGLPPEVIACAETQERFCWACHPSLTDTILKHYNETWDLPKIAENARAAVIGKVTGTGIYQLKYRGQLVCDAKATDITLGLQYTRKTASPDLPRTEPTISCEGATISVGNFSTTISDVFKAMLAHPNHASKSPAFLHYDKNVIGNTIIEAGEADAGVIAPLAELQSYVQSGTHPGWDLPESDRKIGVAVAGDGNGRYGRISAYWQGANAAVEAMMNVAAVGATPRALTDCLNYGNPEISSHLGALEEGVRGISDAARSIAIDGEPVPVISGNVSLYNSLPDGSAIPPTAIVCAIGVMKDASKAVTMQFKKPDSTLLLIGERKDECGGSAYYEVLESLSRAPYDTLLGSNVPRPDFALIGKQIAFVTDLIARGLIRASHDISDGGILLALLEMTLPQRKLGGTIGATLDLDSLQSKLRSDTLLFLQTPGFAIEVATTHAEKIIEEASSTGITITAIGTTTTDATITVRRSGQSLLQEDLPSLHTLHAHGLKKALQGSGG